MAKLISCTQGAEGMEGAGCLQPYFIKTTLQDVFGTSEPNHGGPGVCVGATNDPAAVCLRQCVKLNSSRSCCTKFRLPFNTSHFVFSSHPLRFLETKRSRRKLSEALPPTLHTLILAGHRPSIFHLGLRLTAPSNQLFQPASPIP